MEPLTLFVGLSVSPLVFLAAMLLLFAVKDVAIESVHNFFSVMKK